MKSTHKYAFITIAAVEASLFSFIGLSLIVKPNGAHDWAGHPLNPPTQTENYNVLTSDILQAIYELENYKFELFDKPIEYSTRVYRVMAHEPHILRMNYFTPDSESFILSKPWDYQSLADFFLKNPKQQMIVNLSSLEDSHFLENAYFYRPDGWVENTDMLMHNCHNVCNPGTIRYDMAKSKIVSNDAIRIIRRTVIAKPAKVETPLSSKTKN